MLVYASIFCPSIAIICGAVYMLGKTCRDIDNEINNAYLVIDNDIQKYKQEVKKEKRKNKQFLTKIREQETRIIQLEDELTRYYECVNECINQVVADVDPA